MLLREHQSVHFGAETSSIQLGTKQPNLVRQLKLYLDDDGLLRSRDRLHNAPLPQEAKCPILISPNTRLCELLVRDAHYMMSHMGVSATMTYLRQKFWVPKLRQFRKRSSILVYSAKKLQENRSNYQTLLHYHPCVCLI